MRNAEQQGRVPSQEPASHLDDRALCSAFRVPRFAFGGGGAVRERVLVAMSGGVDSSVAAALLVEAGYDVVGATMKLFCYGDAVPERPCCSLDSLTHPGQVPDKRG